MLIQFNEFYNEQNVQKSGINNYVSGSTGMDFEQYLRKAVESSNDNDSLYDDEYTVEVESVKVNEQTDEYSTKNVSGDNDQIRGEESWKNKSVESKADGESEKVSGKEGKVEDSERTKSESDEDKVKNIFEKLSDEDKALKNAEIEIALNIQNGKNNKPEKKVLKIELDINNKDLKLLKEKIGIKEFSDKLGKLINNAKKSDNSIDFDKLGQELALMLNNGSPLSDKKIKIKSAGFKNSKIESLINNGDIARKNIKIDGKKSNQKDTGDTAEKMAVKNEGRDRFSERIAGKKSGADSKSSDGKESDTKSNDTFKLIDNIESKPGDDKTAESLVKNVDFKEQVAKNVTGNELRETASKNSDKIFKQLVNNTKMMMSNNQKTISTVLRPEELGRIDMKISVKDGKLTGRFILQNQEVADFFRSNVESLRAVFQRDDVDMVKIDVEVAGQFGENASESEDFEEAEFGFKSFDKVKVQFDENIMERQSLYNRTGDSRINLVI